VGLLLEGFPAVLQHLHIDAVALGQLKNFEVIRSQVQGL
jgi:hypothetical protein